MPKRRAPESSDSQDDDLFKRFRLEPTQESENNQELIEIDSQATASGSITDSRPPTSMMLAQRTQSFEPPLPDRQPSDEGYSLSLGNTQSSEEINILEYLPDHDPIQSVVGLSQEEAREVILRQGRTLPTRNPQPHEENREDAPNSQNEYYFTSQSSDGTNNHITVTPAPDHQPSDDLNDYTQDSNGYGVYSDDDYQGRQPSEEFPFNMSTQSTGPNRNDTAETFVPPYLSQATGSNNGDTQAYFFSIEDYNLPKEIFDKSFDKLSKTLENNILDLDFSNTLPMGLISIILYSYIEEI